jgi:DNA-binding NarL/FixJ family response regulator
VVGRAGSGIEAIELFDRLRPDVTLMDLAMPEMSGVEAIVRIRKMHPDARIVVLTTFDGDEDAHRALGAGAVSYQVKDGEPEDLLAAVRAAARGHRSLPPRVALALEQRDPSSALSARELEILEAAQMGLSNAEIARLLGLRESTVKFHMKNVFFKLDVSDRTEAVSVALRRGILHLR